MAIQNLPVGRDPGPQAVMVHHERLLVSPCLPALGADLLDERLPPAAGHRTLFDPRPRPAAASAYSSVTHRLTSPSRRSACSLRSVCCIAHRLCRARRVGALISLVSQRWCRYPRLANPHVEQSHPGSIGSTDSIQDVSVAETTPAGP